MGRGGWTMWSGHYFIFLLMNRCERTVLAGSASTCIYDASVPAVWGIFPTKVCQKTQIPALQVPGTDP